MSIPALGYLCLGAQLLWKRLWKGSLGGFEALLPTPWSVRSSVVTLV